MSDFLIHKPSKSILLPLSTAVPDYLQSRKAEFGGKIVRQVEHDEKATYWMWETLGLRNCPAPAELYFKWPKIEGKYNPMPHQKVAVGFMSTYRRCHNLSEPRTGKTYSVIMTFAYLKEIGEVDKMVVFSTLSTVSTVWQQGVFDCYPELHCIAVTGDSTRRKEYLKMKADVYVLNHDAVKGCEKELHELCDKRTYIVWDEADNLVNPQSAMWKAFNRVAKEEYRLTLLSGTPTGERPTDAWALARLVDKTKVPKYWGSFRQLTMYQAGPYLWKPRKDAHVYVHAALQPAICFRKADVLKDLPLVSHERIECELTDDQKRMMKELQNEMAFEFAGEKTLSVNGADKILKGMQIMLGVFNSPNGYVEIGAQPRVDCVLKLIKSASKKVIIFCAFKGAIAYYAREIGNYYSVAVVTGDTPKKDRDDIFKSFQCSTDPHVCICHPKTTAHGLELSAADTIIWLGPVHSGKQYMQATERNNSIKQDSPMMVYYVGATKFEWNRYDHMTGKKKEQEKVLDMYKELMDERFG